MEQVQINPNMVARMCSHWDISGLLKGLGINY